MKKRGQQLFGMSFSVIFGIILTVVLIGLASYMIVKFLEYRTCADIGLFVQDVDDEVKEAWNSQQKTGVFTSTLPSKIEYVCFANLSAPMVGANTEEGKIFREIERYEVYKASMFLYPPEKACNIEYKKIEHIIFEKNPTCFPVVNGKVQIKIQKGFNDALVKIG